MTSKRLRQRGGSSIEFALLTLVWLPLLLGTLAIGTTMIRGLQTVQVVRDAGHMYARGVDFKLTPNQDMLARLGKELGLARTGGDGVVIFSTISYIGRYQCKALGLADNSDPPNPTAECTNYKHFVFTHRVTMGNTSLRTSNIGTPPSGLVEADGYIKRDVYTKNSAARADSFTWLPMPKEDGTDGFQAGHFAYLVEAYFKSPDLPGFMTGMGTYAHSIF